MTALSDEFRKALDEAMKNRPVGHIRSGGKFANIFQLSDTHRTLIRCLGLPEGVGSMNFERLTACMAEHIYSLQARIDKLEAKSK